jgi:hypothetical protein
VSRGRVDFRAGERMTPETFVAKWKHATLGERQAAQEHWCDVCRMLGQPTPAEADPTGVNEAELKKRTLTNLYNERPEWLHHAHLKLDQAVFEAYGWQDLNPADLHATKRPNPGESPAQATARQQAAEEEMLRRLLALNGERAECR